MRIYFIRAGFGLLGDAWVERGSDEATWSETVKDIADGQWGKVLQVIEVDMARGTNTDVTNKTLLVASLVKEGVPLRVAMAHMVVASAHVSVDSMRIS